MVFVGLSDVLHHDVRRLDRVQFESFDVSFPDEPLKCLGKDQSAVLSKVVRTSLLEPLKCLGKGQSAVLSEVVRTSLP